MATCLVTGGAGFIGSHLVEALMARGDRVRVLDDFRSGTLSNLEAVRGDIDLMLGNVSDGELLQRAVRDVDLLFHLASPAWTPCEPTDVLDAKWASASETLQVLLAARAARVQRVIYASSCRLYGPSEAASVKEDDWIHPESTYGFAKLAGEMQCMGFCSLYGLETVRLRYSNTFGPRQCPSSAYARALPTIVKAMLAGEPPVLDESPLEYHDFIHVDDVVHATLLAADVPRAAGEVYNIARGRSVTLLEVVETVNELLGTALEPIDKQPNSCQATARIVDIRRAERELGFCPSIDLRQGLSRLIEYYADQSGFPLPGRVTRSRERRGPHFSGSRRTQPAGEPKPTESGNCGPA
jgi:UDP-glucose 4-epimerase